MSLRHPDRERAWVYTNWEGRIENLSRAAAELFGVERPSSGQNLLLFFPIHHKAMTLDIHTARTGWPSDRTAVVKTSAHEPLTVRYRVSARFMADQPGLHWVFDVVAGECVRPH